MMMCASLAMVSCSGNKQVQQPDDSTDNLTLYVGSYSEPGDSALRVYTLDAATGATKCLGVLPVANASYFTQAPSGMIYCVSESDLGNSSVSALRPRGNGVLPEIVGSQPAGGASPCYIAVSPDDRFVVTANYEGGNVSVYPVDRSGALSPMNELISFSGKGPVAERQGQSHPHCIAFTPDGKYMLVDDLGTDRIHQFAVKHNSDSLTAAAPDNDIVIKPGSGPRHIVFNAKGDMAYLINEISDEVTVLKYDGQNLDPVQYIPADTVGAGGAGDIHLSPDGRHLYASLRLKNDGIAVFDVDPSTGLLTHKAHIATAGHPRNFTLTPDGRMMLVACRDGNVVEIFAVDPESGALTKTDRIIDVTKPVCVKIIDPEAVK